MFQTFRRSVTCETRFASVIVCGSSMLPPRVLCPADPFRINGLVLAERWIA